MQIVNHQKSSLGKGVVYAEKVRSIFSTYTTIPKTQKGKCRELVFDKELVTFLSERRCFLLRACFLFPVLCHRTHPNFRGGHMAFFNYKGNASGAQRAAGVGQVE
jgi:hypothetical protein